MIIQGYFSFQFFNDLFSRVIPADIEISYNFLPLQKQLFKTFSFGHL